MQSRFLNSSWSHWGLAATLFWPNIGWSTLTLSASGVSNSIDAENRSYYAAQKYTSGVLSSPLTDTCPTAVDSGFKVIDLNQNRYSERVAGVNTNEVRFLIASASTMNASSGKTLVVMLRVTNGSTTYFSPISSLNGVSCHGGATCYRAAQTDAGGQTSFDHYYAVPFQSGGTIVGFYPADICSDAYNRFSSNLLTGCELNSNPTIASDAKARPESVPAASNSALTVEFVITELDPASATAPTAAVKDSFPLKLYFQTSAPQMSSCSVWGNGGLYYPGDGQIFIDTTAFHMVKCGSSSVPSGTAPAEVLIGVGNVSPTDPDVSEQFRTNNVVVASGAMSGFTSLSGFTNASTVSDGQYHLSFLVRDAAGLLAPPPDVNDFSTGSFASSTWLFDSVNVPGTCKIEGVQTSPIKGLIAQNRCFIATAAFGSDPDAQPVTLLRQFRDRYLETHFLGQKVVRLYYQFSPAIAEKIDAFPLLRIVALKVLIPFELISWICIKYFGFVRILLLLAMITLLFGNWRWQRGAFYIFVFLVPVWGLLNHSAHAGFVEDVQAGLEERQSAEGYSRRAQEKIGPGDQSSLIEQVQKQQAAEPTPEGGQGYSEKLKTLLPRPSSSPQDRPSAVDSDSLSQKLEPRYTGDIHFAGGLRYNVYSGRGLSGGNDNFATLYSSTYAPEIHLFGEWQPFHSEWLGNFGLIGSLGIAVFKGIGQYEVSGLVNPLDGGSFGDNSRTQMILNLIPVSFGVSYRFNLLRVLRPFASAAGLFYGLIETRNDNGPVKKSFGLGATLSAGVMLLMDWFDSKAAWEGYQSSGLRHSYLTVEYNQVLSLLGDIRYLSSGFQAGIAFEF